MSISNNISLFCREDASNIEGYEEAIKSEEQYDCHHRLELHTDGSLRFTADSLKKLDLYYNRPASEFIFLSHSEHLSLHAKSRWEAGQFERKFGSEHRKHMSESLKGRVRTKEANDKFRQTMTGRKRKPFTEEWKHNLGNFTRGKTWRLVDGKRVWFEKEA
jgi:hypothetical protein